MDYKDGYYELIDENGNFQSVVYIEKKSVLFYGSDVPAEIVPENVSPNFHTKIYKGYIGKFLFQNHPEES